MIYIIVWKMTYMNMDVTKEFYNSFTKNPEPFVRHIEHATTFTSLDSCSKKFRELVLKYPDIDLQIEKLGQL